MTLVHTRAHLVLRNYRPRSSPCLRMVWYLLTRREGNKRGRNGDLQLRSFSFINQRFKKDLALRQWHRLRRERPYSKLGLQLFNCVSRSLLHCPNAWTNSDEYQERLLTEPNHCFEQNYNYISSSDGTLKYRLPILVNLDKINKFTDSIRPVMRTDKTTPLFEGN